MNKIDLCLKIAINAHTGQLDLNGEPLILHALTVGLMGYTDEEKMAGFLHKVIEKTNYSFDDLSNMGVPMGVVKALQLLTPNCNDTSDECKEQALEKYMQHIRNIAGSKNPIAIAVKKNDLTQHIARAIQQPDEIKIYHKALQVITKAYEQITAVKPYQEPEDKHVAYFACGCFWGVQHMFNKQPGVLNTYVGYTGNDNSTPTYHSVRTRETKHVEAIAIEYDPETISYKDLCQLFFEIHDPAQANGQGTDIGEQYTSHVFFTNEKQKTIVEEVMNDLQKRGYQVLTKVDKMTKFWIAEEYHQDYYDKTGGTPYCHIRQKKF